MNILNYCGIRNGLVKKTIIIGLALCGMASAMHNDYPKNRILVDLCPVLYGMLLNAIFTTSDVEGSGFGIGLQYERVLNPQIGLAGRFDYLGVSTKAKGDLYDGTATVQLGVSTFNFEFQPRYYQFGGRFYIGGVLGLGNLGLDMKGEVNTDSGGESVSFRPSRSYIRIGPAVGWRNDLWGGFTLENTFGYNYSFLFGKTFVEQVNKKIGANFEDKSLDNTFDMFVRLLSSGYRWTFAVGWRF